MSYTATGNEDVTLVIDKPESTRWSAVVSTAACGTLTPELACMSEYSDPSLPSTFSLAARQTAYQEDYCRLDAALSEQREATS